MGSRIQGKISNLKDSIDMFLYQNNVTVNTHEYSICPQLLGLLLSCLCISFHFPAPCGFPLLRWILLSCSFNGLSRSFHWPLIFAVKSFHILQSPFMLFPLPSFCSYSPLDSFGGFPLIHVPSFAVRILHVFFHVLVFFCHFISVPFICLHVLARRLLSCARKSFSGHLTAPATSWSSG